MSNYHIIRPATHEGWMAERQNGVGSSEAAAIMGLSEFDTKLSIWRRKMGLSQPTEETETMMLGHALEPGVAYMFERRTGAIIDKDSEGDWIAVNNDKPFLRVSPDRLYWPAGTPENERTIENALMLECKTTSKFVTREEFPDYWYMQIQYQMGVLGMKKCCIAWISTAGRLHFDYAEVAFNPTIFSRIVRTIEEFWNEYVIMGVEPEEVMSRSDADLKYPNATAETKVVVKEDDEVIEAVRCYVDAKEREKKAKEDKEFHAAAICAKLGGKETMVTEAGNVLATWKNAAGRTSFNEAGFKEANPELYKQYVSKSAGGRRLVVKGV